MKKRRIKNIGVFGDSYAAKIWWDRIWWQVLKEKYHYQVQSWGEVSSSIEFSARLLDAKARDYDHCVWCVTTPGRYTVYKDFKTWVHVIDSLVTENDEFDPAHRKAISIASHEFRKWIFDWDQANFAGRAIVDYIMRRHKNILIVPAFRAPIYSDFGQRGFNLYDVSEMEARHHFGADANLADIYRQYTDLRPGHLCENNSAILAELIHNNLEHKILEADISMFQSPGNTFDECWRKN